MAWLSGLGWTPSLSGKCYPTVDSQAGVGVGTFKGLSHWASERGHERQVPSLWPSPDLHAGCVSLGTQTLSPTWGSLRAKCPWWVDSRAWGERKEQVNRRPAPQISPASAKPHSWGWSPQSPLMSCRGTETQTGPGNQRWAKAPRAWTSPLPLLGVVETSQVRSLGLGHLHLVGLPRCSPGAP